MSILAKDESKEFERTTPGMHDAVCVFVVDVGTHINKTHWGDKKQHQVVICWELAGKMTAGDYAGKPFMASRRYAFSLWERTNLSKHLESWFAKKISDETRKNGFDLEKLIGKRCTLNLVESKDGKYLNVDSVLPANAGNALVPVCNQRPGWIDKLITTSLELNGGLDTVIDQTPPAEDDLPF